MILWDMERPKLRKKAEGMVVAKNWKKNSCTLLQDLGMEGTIFLLSIKCVKTDAERSPHPSVTVPFQEGQLNIPVHHPGSSEADIWKVDLKVSI